MSVFRACAAAAVVLAFAVQPGIAASFPADSSQPSSARGRLLHLVHGEHEECVLAHRHRWDGRVVPCLLEDTDDDEDDGVGHDDEGDDDDDDEANCVQVGPLQVCQ